MNAERFDFVVIGSGLAGLAFALRASQHGNVCVLTKAEVRESNTNYAQGGIAARETHRAGHGRVRDQRGGERR
jgi:L-aspartate oxidase